MSAGSACCALFRGGHSKAEEEGERIPSAAYLGRTIAEVERLRAEALDNWPWPPTPEVVAEAVADYERGDSLPPDEAFVEIAGVSKDARLSRVREYRDRPDHGYMT